MAFCLHRRIIKVSSRISFNFFPVQVRNPEPIVHPDWLLPGPVFHDTKLKLGSSTYFFLLFPFLVFTKSQVLHLRVGRSRDPLLQKTYFVIRSYVERIFFFCKSFKELQQTTPFVPYHCACGLSNSVPFPLFFCILHLFSSQSAHNVKSPITLCASDDVKWSLCDDTGLETEVTRGPGNLGPARRVAERPFLIVTGEIIKIWN